MTVGGREQSFTFYKSSGTKPLLLGLLLAVGFGGSAKPGSPGVILQAVGSTGVPEQAVIQGPFAFSSASRG